MCKTTWAIERTVQNWDCIWIVHPMTLGMFTHTCKIHLLWLELSESIYTYKYSYIKKDLFLYIADLFCLMLCIILHLKRTEFHKICYENCMTNNNHIQSKYKMKDKTRQTKAMHKIAQERQTRQQRRPSQPSQRLLFYHIYHWWWAGVGSGGWCWWGGRVVEGVVAVRR